MNWIKNTILSHCKLGFFLLFPLLFTHLITWFTKGVIFKTDVVENILFAIIIFFIFSVFKNNKWLKVYVFLLYILALIVEFSYLYLFKSYINSSSFFILFQSNATEINSFFNHFVDFWLIFTWTGLFLMLVLGCRYIFCVKSDLFFLNKKISFVTTILLMLLHFFSPLAKSNFYNNATLGFLDYRKDKKAYDKVKFDKTSAAFTNVQHLDDEEVCVLVIGESTTKNHMSLYGYNRKTTPVLDSLSDQLYVFNNVVTPHTHTLDALEKVLTLGNTKNETKKFDGTILQLFNAAEFQTYWLSNQPPSGLWDNFITGIACSATQTKFINISNDKTPFDADLIPHFNSILKQKGAKKLIVLHLMGTHFVYENRYPNSFSFFTNAPQTPFASNIANQQINSYDNAIRYQDFVWSKIIKQLDESDVKASAVFLSDHGEEVYQSMNYAGHAETNGTKNMYDIPFIVWLSPEKIAKNSFLQFQTNRSYSTENLIYTMAELADIHFNEMQPSLSIFNSAFIPQQRLIFNKQDYDAYFKK